MQEKADFDPGGGQVVAQLNSPRGGQSVAGFDLDDHLPIHDHVYPLQSNDLVFEPHADRGFTLHAMPACPQYFC